MHGTPLAARSAAAVTRLESGPPPPERPASAPSSSPAPSFAPVADRVPELRPLDEGGRPSWLLAVVAAAFLCLSFSVLPRQAATRLPLLGGALADGRLMFRLLSVAVLLQTGILYLMLGGGAR